MFGLAEGLEGGFRAPGTSVRSMNRENHPSMQGTSWWEWWECCWHGKGPKGTRKSPSLLGLDLGQDAAVAFPAGNKCCGSMGCTYEHMQTHPTLGCTREWDWNTNQGWDIVLCRCDIVLSLQSWFFKAIKPFWFKNLPFCGRWIVFQKGDFKSALNSEITAFGA